MATLGGSYRSGANFNKEYIMLKKKPEDAETEALPTASEAATEF